ncbi:unnamed protein product [Didymodactylos carnosus]|uniref:Cytohesin-1 n=1 Tax=Didymodactylos carnosus TaxID=1234261 RepID=A0A813X0U7_9BILA|nr:unnamed protein product [Didymodactylos carnosus]CAF1354942.1 unnamed protein product [Didymodactylos carnosus]CAF3652403.1 unnamed protein product [Didymodactylos carnosus]CAF4165257.1 unnamed protein product [Didymodactylos carnosus]
MFFDGRSNSITLTNDDTSSTTSNRSCLSISSSEIPKRQAQPRRSLFVQERRPSSIDKRSTDSNDDNNHPKMKLKPMKYIRRFSVSFSLRPQFQAHRRNPNVKQWIQGKKHFNANPKEGIQWLVENSLLQNTPEHVAAFLYKENGLSKRAIGEYLGEKDDFHIEVLKYFAHMHDFRSMCIVEALRQYLFVFLLPGEAQKIDRMMEAFAQRFYECNPHAYSSSEVCYIISFATIMLNTSLHNKNAKPTRGIFTLEKFQTSLTEAITTANGQIPDPSTIKAIYDNIKNNELKFPEDGFNCPVFPNNGNVIKEGFLFKQGGRYRNWKRRWFVITEGCLYYFESTTDREPRGIIPLVNVDVRDSDDRTKQFCFELFPLAGDKVKACKPVSGDFGKTTEGHHTVYRMTAASEEDRKEWIRCLRYASQNQLPKHRYS